MLHSIACSANSWCLAGRRACSQHCGPRDDLHVAGSELLHGRPSELMQATVSSALLTGATAAPMERLLFPLGDGRLEPDPALTPLSHLSPRCRDDPPLSFPPLVHPARRTRH